METASASGDGVESRRNPERKAPRARARSTAMKVYVVRNTTAGTLHFELSMERNGSIVLL